MDIKDYILWGGGALIGLVVLHGLWMAWRSRRGEQDAAVADDSDPQQADLPSLATPATSATPAEDVDYDHSVVVASAVEREHAEQGAVVDEIEVAYPEQDVAAPPPKRGRRLMIPGKRTEPTVSRTSRRFDAVQAQRAEAEETKEQSSNGLDDIVVIWVVARPGATLEGQGLLSALTSNHLRYGGNVFSKLDPNTSAERYKVVNGVEPGTFDLSDLDALSTPRIVLLLRFSPHTDPAAAFEDMLEVAQDIAAHLDAELKDEQMSDMSSQTIEHCRQRIREHKRMSIRK